MWVCHRTHVTPGNSHSSRESASASLPDPGNYPKIIPDLPTASSEDFSLTTVKISISNTSRERNTDSRQQFRPRLHATWERQARKRASKSEAITETIPKSRAQRKTAQIHPDLCITSSEAIQSDKFSMSHTPRER